MTRFGGRSVRTRPSYTPSSATWSRSASPTRRASWGSTTRGESASPTSRASVPDNLDAGLTDEQLADAARLLRRYHDATAGSALAGVEEVVCHNDISPVNTVFVDGRPTALFDFDMARPGPRIRDVSYGMFLWLNLGWDGPPPEEQRRRIRLWCDSYGLADRSDLVDEVKQRVRETAIRRRGDGAEDAARWWQHQLEWLERHERAIAP